MLGAAIATEFVGVQWWSAVDLAKLEQVYVIVGRGQVVIGERGTAGFFNRRIPPAGVAAYWPREYSQESWMRRVLIMKHTRPQLRAIGIPLVSPGLLIGALGSWFHWKARLPKPGRCPNCGYDLAGLSGGACPECGTLVTACASSTSQPG